MYENTFGVIVPTLGKNIKGLRAIRDYYCYFGDDISIYIIYKNSEINSSYFYDLFKGCDIPLNVIDQRDGGFVSALNIAFKEVKEPIIIMNDDDVLHMPGNLEVIKNYFLREDVGVLTGLSHGQRTYQTKQVVAMTLNYFFNKEPLSPLISDYLVQVNSSGLLSMNFLKFIRIGLHERRINEYKTMRPYGASLALKRNCVEDFEIPDVTLRGIGNETVISLHCLMKYNLHTIFSPKFQVNHEDRKESLSRTSNNLQIAFEFYLLPLILHLAGADINITHIRNVYNRLRKISGLNSYIAITLKALELDIELISSNIGINSIRDKITRIEKEI